MTALVIAVICGLFEQGTNSARSAIIARAFTGESRVHARAVLRTVTNVSIAAGSGLGAVALAIGTAEAYRALIIGAGVLFLLGLFQLVRLPARVAAETAASAAEAKGHRGIAVGVDLAAVELRALRLVGQQVIGLGDVGEFLRRVRLVLVAVGMQFLGELAICGLDFRFARAFRDAEGGIGICHLSSVAR